MSVNATCPRCGNNRVVELGTPVIRIGKTRGLRVKVKECVNCSLIYYEKYET